MSDQPNVPEQKPEKPEVEAERFDAKTSEGRTYDMPKAGDMPEPGAAAPTQANLSLAALCHLLGLADATISFLLMGLIAPLVLWLVLRDTDPEVDFAGRESVNFQINLLVWHTVALILCLCLIGALLFPILWIAEVVLIIVATVQTLRGERYRYPLIFRVIR